MQRRQVPAAAAPQRNNKRANLAGKSVGRQPIAAAAGARQRARLAAVAAPAQQRANSSKPKGDQKKKAPLKHFWQVADNFDYEAQLAAKGLQYVQTEEGEKLLTLDYGPLPEMTLAEYEAVGDLITGYLQNVMKNRFGMQEIWVGDSANPNGPKVNIFVSDDFFVNMGRCLVLLQGTGACRAGMWARSLCFNENLTVGSMLPMLEFAKATGQSVLIANPNMAKDPLSGVAVPNCGTMSMHCKYIWEHFLSKEKCPATSLSIMAHSAGGRCTATLFKDYRAEFLQRVKCLVFTDAYYHAMFQGISARDASILAAIGIHFKAYKQGHKDVGVAFQNQNGAIQEVSAGTNVHAYTTGKSLEAVFSFMTDKLVGQ